MEELSGRVAIVTGGASNLGAEIVRAFAEAGATVVVADLVEELPEGLPAALIRTDVTDPDQVDRLMAETVERFGRVDCLVNCAAIWFRHSIQDITPEEWDKVMGVNLRGPFLTIRAVAPIMEAQGAGTIVNIGSHAGIGYTRGQGVHYAATKAGISQLSRVLAFELGPKGIRVNCVAPGAIWNGPGEPPGEIFATMLEQTPLRRFARPVDVAAACRYLVSDAAALVTGQTLLVNGGALAYI